MAELKNLANCKPSEFMVQTMKIRNLVADWLSATKILELRKNLPDIPEGTTKEERTEILMNQIGKNFLNIFDAIFEKNSEKTLALLALLNFVEPEHVDDYEMSDYMESMGAMLGNRGVLSFFTSLVQLDRIGI